jgi:hypothetical protein
VRGVKLRHGGFSEGDELAQIEGDSIPPA